MHIRETDVMSEEMVNIADLCAEMAVEEGVQYMFSLIGDGSLPYDAAMQKHGIKRVLVRHEQSAGFAADAMGRLTRRPGFCVNGSGTGLTNLTTGVVQSYAAGSPLVVLQGDSSTFDDDQYGQQSEARSEQQFAGITKWVRRVTRHHNLLFELKRAFRSAVTPPTGPVVVAYSTELAGMALTGEGGLMVPKRLAYAAYAPGSWAPRVWETLGNPALVEKTVKWLLDAERPCMVVGHAAHQDDCQEELREFVNLLGIPCNSRRIARGMIPEDNPLNYGAAGARSTVLKASDRCMILGLRMSFFEHFGAAPFWNRQTRYCQVQNCQEMVCLNLPTEIELIGHLKMVLRQMIDCAKDMGITKPVEKWGKWRQFVADAKVAAEKRRLAEVEKLVGKMPFHPDLVGKMTADFLRVEYKSDYIAIIDGFTASSYFTNWNIAVNTGTMLDSAETTGIGHGPGMAVAAGLATNREKPIIVLMGDGGVGAGGMDIETCSRWHIPAIFIHENNDLITTGIHENFFGKVCAPTGDPILDGYGQLSGIHFERMFAEFGCHPEFVERDDQFGPALKRACDVAQKEKRPAFIEVFVDREAIHTMFIGNPMFLKQYSSMMRWDELPERGKKVIANVMYRPVVDPVLPEDWKEGIKRELGSRQ